ncbi:MFS transporter [Streptomyces echinatus]|uniref:MFS transporter n=1 Tax=Streptomyces echinatus TaxID=67293 RepID=UPI0037AC3AE0
MNEAPEGSRDDFPARESEKPAAPADRPRLTKAFWLVWWASTLSTLGDGIRYVAFPLVATTLTKDPQAVSIVFAAGYLPWPLFGLVGGAVADRVDRRRLMWTVDAARGVFVAGFAVLIQFADPHVAALASLSFVLGVAETFFDNAASALVPMVAEKSVLERANAWLFSAQTVMSTLVGAPLGAALFAWSPSSPFTADALTFVIAALLVFALRGRYTVRTGPATTTIRRDIVTGLRWLARHRLLRTMCTLVMVSNAALAAAEAVLVLYTLKILGMNGFGYGLLLAVLAVFGVLGSALAEQLRRATGIRTVLVGSTLIQACAYTSAGVTSNLPAALCAFALVGFGGGVWNVAAVSLRQASVPPELLGRVTSSYRTVGLLAMPVGAGLGGTLATHYGLQAPYLVGGTLLMVTTLLCLPGLRAKESAAPAG